MNVHNVLSYADRAVRRLTRQIRVLPDFLIIGTQKGGTDSLYLWLSRHPYVRPPIRKEIHYFDDPPLRGPNYYREFFPLRFAQNGRITGEASPYYLFHPRVPSLVQTLVPDVRNIVLLRDPVKRAYSHYHHSLRKGREQLTFEQAIEAEETRLQGEEDRLLADPNYASFAHPHYSYFARGQYARQLLRWFDLFPRERFLILRSESLFTASQGELEKVCAFLGIPFSNHPFKAQGTGSYEPMRAATTIDLHHRYAYDSADLERLLGPSFRWEMQD